MPYAGDGKTIGANLRGGADPGDQKDAYHRPENGDSLTRRDKCDAPADQHRGGEIVKLPKLEIQVFEAVYGLGCVASEGRLGSGKKDLPAGEEIDAGKKISHRQQYERGEPEGGPGRAGRPGLELTLHNHRVGKIVQVAQAKQRCGLCFFWVEAGANLFCSQVGEMVGELVEITPRMTRRD